MEREPIRQAQGGQSELTAQGQNTYSRSEGNIMPDGVSPDIGSTPDQAAGQGASNPIELSETDIEQRKSVLSSPYSSSEQKAAARKILEAAGINHELQEANDSRQGGQSTSAGGGDRGGRGGRSDRLTAEGDGSSDEGSKPPSTLREALAGRYGDNTEIADRAMKLTTREQRNAEFNDIYLALDSQPEKFSQDLMNAMTEPGRRYEAFINSLTRIATGPAGADLGPEKLKEIQEDFDRFQKEAAARNVLHDVTSILYISGVKGETLFGYIEKFESSLVDMAFTTPGIREMIDMYEFSIRESMATHKFKGFLDPEKIRSRVDSSTFVDKEGIERGEVKVIPAEIDQRAIALFREMMEKGLIKSRTKDGQEFNLKDMKLEPWEITRIFNIARGTMIASGRMVSLAAESKLPPDSTRFASGFLQDIVQEYSALRHLNAKWQIAAEGLAAYLYKGSTGNVEADGLLRRWNPKELKEMWARYQDDMPKLLHSLTNNFYLGRINPNRAGDVWTWMSWRAENRSDAVTMVENFLVQGERKMAERWDAAHRDKQPSAATYIAFLKDPKYKVKPFNEEEFFSMTKEQRDREKSKRKSELISRADAWAAAHPGAIGIEQFEEFYTEYQNWSGTGFRFEKLRPALEKAVDYSAHVHGHEREENIEKGMTILRQMATLQGHRLYGNSEFVRGRIDDAIKNSHPEMKDHIQVILGDVQLAESAFLNAREEILDKGISFAQAELDMVDHELDFFERAITEDLIKRDKFGNPIKDAEGNNIVILKRDDRIKFAKKFIELVKEDFHAQEEAKNPGYHPGQGSHHDAGKKEQPKIRGKYFEEFIKKREYTHGFVLWTGDVPIDEYNATSVGQTGAFVRRARDNKNQGLATGAETKLLDNLKNIHNPDQILEAMEEIFASIDHYDRGKAQQAISEKLLGVLRFYKTDSTTKIPIVGLVHKKFKQGDVSFARMMYGNDAMALESSQIRRVVRHFGHTKKITHEQEKWLLDKLGATKKHVAYELGLDIGELGFLAILMELMSVVGREIAGGVQDAG